MYILDTAIYGHKVSYRVFDDKMVLVFIETHCHIKFSRSILPWMQEVSNNPKLLKHIFGCKEKEFKRLYGEFALNKTKSEAIIGQHNEYFNVRI